MAAHHDPDCFNKLPLSGESEAKFTAINGDNLVSTIFPNLLTAHKMDRTFGVTLLHRHFELDPDERLVEYRGTSIPWVTNKLANNIKPSN
jgi:hypothetical protein